MKRFVLDSSALLMRIPVNVTSDSGIVTGIPVNVTGAGVARF